VHGLVILCIIIQEFGSFKILLIALQTRVVPTMSCIVCLC